MNPAIVLAIAAGLLALGTVLRGRLLLLLTTLVVMGAGPVNPTVQTRSAVISTVTTIAATTIDADAAAGYYEIPRGAENISFTFLSTLNTGFSTGSVFFTGQIVGSDDPSGTFTPIEATLTAELVVDVGQTLPTAANAPGLVLPRFIKVKWTETGSMTSFTGTCTIRYNLRTGAGRQYAANNLGG